MRILMWFTMGFGALCAAAAYSSAAPGISLAMAAALPAAALWMICKKRRSSLPVLAVISAGAFAGLIWCCGFAHFRLRPLEPLNGQEQILSVTAEDYSYETPYGTGADGSITIEGKRYPLRIYLDGSVTLRPGDRVEGPFRIRLTVVTNGESSAYYQGNGIFLLGYQNGEVTIAHSEQMAGRYLPAVFRQRLLQTLDTLFAEDTAPFAKALLLGHTRELDYATDTAFRISGIRHIVAVSGLHISILYGLIALVTLRRRYLTALVGIPVLVLFAAMAGFLPSVVRAGIMVGLMMLAMLFDREYDPSTALSFSVLVMLLVNPLAVTSVSLQLSAGCVAGILLFNAPVSRWLQGMIPEAGGIAGRLRSFFCGSVSVTVSAMSLITPLSALYFGAVSLVGVVTNLLTLWVVTFLFSGIGMVCLLFFLHPGIAGILAGLLAWPARYVLFVARTMASLPLAAVYTESVYIVLWLAFVYLLLALFLFAEKKRPGQLMAAMILSLCMALLASWLEPLSSETRITMLDVGQGQAILLQSEGKTFLVDCGGEDDADTADIVAEALLSQGIDRLHGIIVTHYDRDHAGALQNLLTRIHTDHLFLPDTQNEMELPEMEIDTVYVWEDVVLSFGESRITIFGPVYSGEDNENSLCVLFDTEKCDILITGDRSAFGERMLLRRTDLPDVDILVAGHHGAADSSSEELLQTVRPETVLISAGENTIYKHPAPDLLQRLDRFGCTVYRTDLHGTITIRR
ncbi:MAG: DNA internalization-related competence protein ComEC/Rec2 [Oscillospiraceae bacterium]|nr:DNA internalization-related competence protein ComEC/Rec2 [Oscillospiraceae bacterium]